MSIKKTNEMYLFYIIVTPPDGYICKICNVKGHYIKDCPQKLQSSLHQLNNKTQTCWFCLANPDVEKTLIIEYINNILV